MGQDPISFIIQLFVQLYAFIIILRFLLQVSKADYYNPISQAVVKLTSKPLAPLQKAIPRIGSTDISPLVFAYLIIAGGILLLQVLKGYSIGPIFTAVLVESFIRELKTILDIYFFAVLGSVIISWVAPNSYHPGPQLIMQLTEPLYKITRKVIPSLGGLDLSPILIFIVIQIINAQLSVISRIAF